MSRERLSRLIVGRAAAAVRQHFADPTLYARRYRAAVGARDALPPRWRPAAGGDFFRIWTWWLPHPRRGAARPDAFERWLVRPVIFLPTILIGLAVVRATFGVSRDTPLSQQLPVMAGVLAAWSGLTGAMGYAGRRWPRAEPVLIVVGVLFSVTLVVFGMLVLDHGAVGNLLLDLGLWTLMSLAVAWWKNRPGKGEG